MNVEYLGLREIRGNLIILDKVNNVAFDDIVEIKIPNNPRPIMGRVIQIIGDVVIVLVFEGTHNLSLTNTITQFTGKPMTLPLSEEILGRTFDGMGRPLDGFGRVYAPLHRDINGTYINPTRRIYPRAPLFTGFSAIDGLATLVKGQKLPIFSGDGLPHDILAACIAANAEIVVFAAMGIKNDTANYFRRIFEENNALNRSVLFLNLANDPPAERVITPRLALTAAEYLAFDLGYDVLVILTDMTAYAEAVREISSVLGEIPSRKGYPGYLYSDFASLYERAGIIHGKPGSLTQIPILTMPGDDITHPVADLTGYITEGQIVLERSLHNQNIFPPIAVLPSLSRLMKDGIGEGKTIPEHAKIAHNLFSYYAQAKEIRAMLSVIGEEDLSESDKKILFFGEQFEQKFIRQGNAQTRSIGETLALANKILGDFITR